MDGGVVTSSRITQAQLYNIHPLVHILFTCSWISVVAPFLQPPHGTASRPSPSDKSPVRGRMVPKNTRFFLPEPSKKWLRDLHMHQGYPLLPIFRALSRSLLRHPSVAQGHLPSLTQSIQPDLCLLSLLLTRSPIISAINTILPYGSRKFSPRVRTIQILSDPLYSPTPFLFQLFYASLHS